MALIQSKIIHTVNLSSFHLRAKYTLNCDKKDYAADPADFKVCMCTLLERPVAHSTTKSGNFLMLIRIAVR